MKSAIVRLGKLLLLGVPLLLGIIGLYTVAGESFLDSAFLTLTMYVMNYADTPPNVWVELARWTAPLATASGIVLAINTMYRRARAALTYLLGDSTAVFGPEEETEQLLSRLGSCGISCGGAFVRAHRYILLGTEEENLEFCRRYSKKLDKRTVYLKTRSIPALAGADPRVRLFCPEETAARLFWKEHCMYGLSAKNDHSLRIVLVGFGKLGEELLTSALLSNIFSPRQKIEYHVLGDGGGFRELHPCLDEISDPVKFHSEPWYTHLDLINGAQAVIVCEQAEQLTIVQKLLSATRIPKLHVLTSDPMGIRILAEQDRLELYDWKQYARKPEHILSEKLYERAKRINLRYANIYGGVAETDENSEAEWKKLNAFTRYSNVSSADYHEIQRRILQLRLPGTAPAAIPLTLVEEFAELEHIRWCRYHYLNNWSYGVPDNGKAKDPVQRIHKMLIPYARLTETEREKDRENIRVLFSLE